MIRIILAIRNKFVLPLQRLALLFLLIVFSLHYAELGGTLAVTSDLEKSKDNLFQAGVWGEEEGVKILITEVYYDPDDDHGGSNDEWIEIYNAGTETVNLQNWYFKDASGAVEEISSSYEIEPGQIVLLSANSGTWNTWPLVPANANKIALGGQKLFYNLNNSGESLVLFDKDDHLIDAMSYGDDASVFDPACNPVAKGSSFERIDYEIDTDKALDFEAQPAPTPGLGD